MFRNEPRFCLPHLNCTLTEKKRLVIIGGNLSTESHWDDSATSANPISLQYGLIEYGFITGVTKSV